MGTTASSSLFAIDPLLLEILSSLDFTQRESLLTLNKRTGDLLTSEAAYMVRRGMLRTSQRARAGGGGTTSVSITHRVPSSNPPSNHLILLFRANINLLIMTWCCQARPGGATSCCLLSAVCCLLSAVCCLLSAACCLLHTALRLAWPSYCLRRPASTAALATNP